MLECGRLGPQTAQVSDVIPRSFEYLERGQTAKSSEILQDITCPEKKKRQTAGSALSSVRGMLDINANVHTVDFEGAEAVALETLDRRDLVLRDIHSLSGDEHRKSKMHVNIPFRIKGVQIEHRLPACSFASLASYL